MLNLHARPTRFAYNAPENVKPGRRVYFYNSTINFRGFSLNLRARQVTFHVAVVKKARDGLRVITENFFNIHVFDLNSDA